MQRWLVVVAGLVTACGDKDDCGVEQECPTGTVVEEYRANREGFEISGDGSSNGYDDYDGSVAFRHFESGQCRWTCVAIQECPAETVPVITEDCFTCGTWNDSEELEVPDCGS